MEQATDPRLCFASVVTENFA